MYLHYLPASLGRPVFISQCVFNLKNFTEEKLEDIFFFGKKIKKIIFQCVASVTRWKTQVSPWAAFQYQMMWLEASGGTVTQSLTSLLHGMGTVHISENCSCSLLI